jgi:hypothetical protein
LGNQGVRVVYPKEGNPYLVIPGTFNWDAHRRLRDTIGELLKMGGAGFPDLAEHVKDDRFSCFVVGAVDRPHNVGWICEQLIKCQIDVYPYSVTEQGELVPRYDLEERLLSRSNVSSWAKWWKKHKDKSLLEMQVAVAESSLSILTSEDEGPRFNPWGRRQVKGIEEMIRELRKDKKPRAGVVGFDIHLMEKSGVTQAGDEERYYFSNGK